MDEILNALLPPVAAQTVPQKEKAAYTPSSNSSSFPSFQAGPSKPRQEWKGFKSSTTSTVERPASVPNQKTADRKTSPARSRTQSTAFSSTTITAPPMRKDSSASSDDSVKKYGQFVPKRDIQISYDYGVDYGRNGNNRTLPEFGKRAPKKVSIRGAAERQAARDRGESPTEEIEKENSDQEFRPKPVEPRGWRTHRKQSSSEDTSPDGRKPEKELKDEWDFDDIEEPAPPRAPAVIESDDTGGIIVGGGEYGRIEYGESAPGWQSHITRREDPNLSREEKSLRRFQEATAARESPTYIPDYIPADQYVAPHLGFSRELAFTEPKPKHWVEEEEEDKPKQQQQRVRSLLHS